MQKISIKRLNYYLLKISVISLLLTIILLITNIHQYSIKGKKKEVEKEIENLTFLCTIINPPPFKNVKTLDNKILLQFAILSTLLNQSNFFDYDESNQILVPISCIQESAHKLFGKNIKLKYITFQNRFNTTYTYSPKIKGYHIPITGEIDFHTPQIESIIKKNRRYQLKIGYIPPINGWKINLEYKKFAPKPDKFMICTLKKHKKSFIILSLQNHFVNKN